MSNQISSFEYRHSTNLGDEIQTIAAINAINKLGLTFGEIVDRKNINTENKINLLVNGYFDIAELKNLVNDHINPIFSNLHIACQDTTIDSKIIKNYKKYEPIGCRDKFTTKIFQNNGIDAFFNYCLTLTFDKRDENIKGDTVFIVDLDAFLPLPKHLKKEKVIHLTHHSGNIYSHKAKMILANELLERYKQEAKLVITGRLHCALPCIAMGIPVILFSDKADKRMQLAEEFIPIHHYWTIKFLSFRKRLKSPSKIAILIQRIKIYTIKIYTHIRYYHYYKTQIDWDPKSIDIEKTKALILDNLNQLYKASVK